MNTGVIKQAKEDELVTLGDRQFMRWIVQVELPDGTTTQSSVLRRPDSPDPTGLSAEEKPQGGWKVSQQQDGGQRGSQSAKSEYKADPDKIKAENKRSALHHATNLAIAQIQAGKSITSAQTLQVAAEYYEWIEGPV